MKPPPGESRPQEVRRVALASVILVALVGSIAAGGGASGSGEARASAGVAKQIKKLKRQVQALQQQVDQLQRQPGRQGPQGPQGPSGSSPACQGNGSGDEMVAAGSVCIDKYEVSVWSSPTGGTQYGVSSDDYPCDDDGQNCSNIYARSVPGVTPSRFITWFQAQQALANAGKRLPSNAEWQQAVVGTPDPGPDNGTTDCNSDSTGPVATGSRADCSSDFGAFDMVGNLEEWVADWMPAATACPGWAAFSDDVMCLAGASTTVGPGALHRGGNFSFDTDAGPLAVIADQPPSFSNEGIGLRGVR